MRPVPNPPGGSPGLALTRYVPWSPRGEKEDAQRAPFFGRVKDMAAGPEYRSAFDRWKNLMDHPGVLRATGVLGGPLAVGLGNESPSEVSLTLHRIYGMPLVPGSAIKGACSRALERLDATERVRALSLFGSPNDQGYAIFHDAWYNPEGDGKPFAVDTVTVHHPVYYQSSGKDAWPTDFDDPVPVTFMSVKPGARFFFAVEVPGADAAWLAFVEGMLKHTLTEIGLGGKTNAGYGWFKEVTIDHPKSNEELLEPYRARIAQLRGAGDVSQAQSILLSVESRDLKRVVAEALKDHIATKLNRWTKDTIDKPWRKAIEEALE